MVSKEKKKKVFTETETDFSAEIGNSSVFSVQNQVVSKKKKKKVFTEIGTDFSGKRFKRLRGGCFPMGGYFQFFTKNRPQKHQKRAILHTSLANGGARAPLPPLATLLPPFQIPGYASEHFCPWPREGLSLASNIFVFFALASSLMSSTPPLILNIKIIISKKQIKQRTKKNHYTKK